MTLQYATAASRAATIYFLSVIWTLAQSLVWMVTAEGLDWIQSREYGPLILEWDSFLLGAVFLTIDIHPDSLEFHHAKKASCIWSSSEEKLQSRSSSQSSSINHGGRRVTFDEQVFVLGRSGAVGGQQQQQRGFTPILNSNSCNSYSYIQDPHAVPTMTESPTRSTFAIPPTSAAPYCSSLSQEAEYLQRNYGYSYSHNYQYQYQYQYTDSPSSSRSNSCRSSICSVSSSESVDSFSSSDSAAKPTASSSTKSNSSASSRLAALFHHHHTPRHNSTLSHSPPTSSASSIDSSNAQPSISGTTKSKNLVHRIMHPHQHKRELELQHQIEFQQQQRRHTQPYHIPEFLDTMTEHEYQPSEHTRKTLKQRLGLNKKKSLSI
ncbi:hypothetical protein BGZ97_008336 [Linnemannia gamsii]|uniref:Uncharacterized protein n=1 Tax=Linnemannia gamsii TaxID=64522 RepID=A0A9P6UDM3_9FUNG|nr:hypothetical protein BGZ97_008336 [Linnemannia gamsii]